MSDDLRAFLEGIVADPDAAAAELEAALPSTVLRVTRAVPGLVRRIVLEQATAALASLPVVDPWDAEAHEIEQEHYAYMEREAARKKRTLNVESARHLAREEARAAVEEMKAKVEQKTRGLTEVVLQRHGGGNWTITGKHGDRAVRLEQQRILKASTKGKLFNQWPMRIYVDGQFTPESVYHGYGMGGGKPEPKVKPLTKAQAIEMRLTEGLDNAGFDWRPTDVRTYGQGIRFTAPNGVRVDYTGDNATLSDGNRDVRMKEAQLFDWLLLLILDAPVDQGPDAEAAIRFIEDGYWRNWTQTRGEYQMSATGGFGAPALDEAAYTALTPMARVWVREIERAGDAGGDIEGAARSIVERLLRTTLLPYVKLPKGEAGGWVALPVHVDEDDQVVRIVGDAHALLFNLPFGGRLIDWRPTKQGLVPMDPLTWPVAAEALHRRGILAYKVDV